MIIGNGLIAKSFLKKYNKDNIVIFASGVSNSQEDNLKNFKREKDLLLNTLETHQEIKFIYFSTILIDYKNNPYYWHKKEMENLVKLHAKDYTIFRVPQLIGSCGNNNNLINYLVGKIRSGESFEVYSNLKRAVVDIEDLVNFVMYCEDKTSCKTVYVGGVEPLSVVDLSKIIQYFFNVSDSSLKMKIKDTNEDDRWTSLTSPIFKDYLSEFGIESKGYTQKIIEKYIK
tara:strand:- start:117 stop:803 length:687 start_codon:yes stop_codon:yes gene_type:complete